MDYKLYVRSKLDIYLHIEFRQPYHVHFSVKLPKQSTDS